MSDEAKEILSRSLVHQIERLTAERDAAVARAEKAEGLLLDAYATWGEWPQETLARIADFLNKRGVDAGKDGDSDA